MALGDAILACLTERPMTGYELAKTFDASIGFFWKADHQQIYRELSRLRDRGHIQGREVVQSGKPNKLVYTLTAEGRAALQHWAARPSSPPSIKDDLLVRLYALDSVDIEPLRDRPDGAAGAPSRPLRPLRAHSQQALSPRHRLARGYRQTARTSPRRFATSGPWRNGAKRRSMPCRRRSRRRSNVAAARGRPARKQRHRHDAITRRRARACPAPVIPVDLTGPVPTLSGPRPNSLTRYLP